MQQAIDLYFKTCEAEKKKPTITRLALALGFESRQSFYDYEKREEFSYIIKRARLEVEAGYEDGLREGGSPVGSIFALKNMGWRDKTETDLNHSGGVSLVFMDTEGCEPIKEADETINSKENTGIQ